MTDRLVRESTSYPLLQRQQVLDPDDEVKDYSELFKETADDMHDMTCNDSYKIYNTEGTPYISHSASFSDLTNLTGPLITAVQDSSPHEEVKVYRTEDTPYNFSNASSFSDLTGMSGQHSISDVTHSALTSPRPDPLPKLFTPAAIAAATSPKLSTVHEDIVDTPLMCSRGSPLGSISDEECNQIGDENGSVCSEFSRREEESEAVSPSDLPESPGEVELPAKRFTKPTPPPLPPKPKGLQIKLQSRRSEAFVPPPTKFQDVPSDPPVLNHSQTVNLSLGHGNGQKDDESDEEEEDDLGDDNDFFKKCLEMGMHARSSVAVPKIIRSETKSQSISTSSTTSQNQKLASNATSACVERNGRSNMSAIVSDSESGDEDNDASDYAFIKMYMEKGLRIEPENEKQGSGVIQSNSPAPPPLPAKRKTVKSAAFVTDKAKSDIGTKPVPRPAVRSGSWIASGNVPQRQQQQSSPSPVFHSGDHSDPRTANSPASSSCSSLRKPYLETDIDSILNYEKFLNNFNAGGAGGSIESHC